MTKQKTYTVKISRDFIYEYEVKANNEDDAAKLLITWRLTTNG